RPLLWHPFWSLGEDLNPPSVRCKVRSPQHGWVVLHGAHTSRLPLDFGHVRLPIPNPMQSANDLPPPPGALGADSLGLAEEVGPGDSAKFGAQRRPWKIVSAAAVTAAR